MTNQLLGDPNDPQNPLGFTAVVAADEAGAASPVATEVLARPEWRAELVPAEDGGRLTGVPRLIDVLRPLFRRDVTAALGVGVVPLLSSSLVWAAGRSDARNRLARAVLEDRRLPLATYAETARGDTVARRHADEFHLQGRRPAVTGVGWTAPATVVARTGWDLGRPLHSVLLVDNSAGPELSREPTGARGLRFGDLEFDRGAAVVGDLNSGTRLTRTALAITRTVLAAGIVGTLDTMLRTAVRSAMQRPRLPVYLRSALVGAFLDVLVLDCLCTVAARTLQLSTALPEAYLDAVSRLSGVLARDVVTALDGVLGVSAHRRDEVFQKHRRDLMTAPMTAAGGARSAAGLLPVLPDGACTEVGPAVQFGLSEALPALELEQLATATPDLSDPVLQAAAAVPTVQTQAIQVMAGCAALPARDRTPLATPEAFQLAGRYAWLIAACSCLGVREHNNLDAVWADGALARVLHRLGEPAQTEYDEVRILTELIDRYESGRSFDLAGTPISG